MDIFRPDKDGFSLFSPKMMLFIFVTSLIIGSFFVQMSMGICPVPP
ncbi:hypothetical protein [Fodinibius salsisoli]|uniref:Uncharacterized protein n=1 Tax=Fodinibius salsisoli TaxID=2820877 RepID=A0ABT3PS81_9BACT|nr:hypothetical protein [Fodinibius salsisoli]MCW9708724.1 hypothetical protein [Fodinibius salsisoli]